MSIRLKAVMFFSFGVVFCFVWVLFFESVFMVLTTFLVSSLLSLHCMRRGDEMRCFKVFAMSNINTPPTTKRVQNCAHFVECF